MSFVILYVYGSYCFFGMTNFNAIAAGWIHSRLFVPPADNFTNGPSGNTPFGS